MLEPLRLRVVGALQAQSAATLSTNGPGGIQAGFYPCETLGLTLYMLVPASADVLYNLESDPAVVVTTPHWQLEGEAVVQSPAEADPALQLPRSPRAAGCVLVSITGRRMHINWTNGWGYRETIDL